MISAKERKKGANGHSASFFRALACLVSMFSRARRKRLWRVASRAGEITRHSPSVPMDSGVSASIRRSSRMLLFMIGARLLPYLVNRLIVSATPNTDLY